MIPTEEESGWLIETQGTYWTGRALIENGFDDDPNEACRFARAEDAERIRWWLLKGYAFALKVTEHVWLARASMKEQADA